MPELPEVHTTVLGLKKTVLGLKITDVWTDLKTKDARQKETVKNPAYFSFFKKNVLKRKIINVERRAKNILIDLDNGLSILVHMKMTGHLLYGKYKKTSKSWGPDESEKNNALRDKFNRFVHVVFSLSNKNHLAFSDMRKFGKITLVETNKKHETKHLKDIGPEPLDKNFKEKNFLERLNKKPKGKIKTVLMDQSVIAGIGNIYSDEALWLSNIHPTSVIEKIPKNQLYLLFKQIKKVLSKGINFGGDSMSDYRNVFGEPGKFQNKHNVYRLKGKKCKKKGCGGLIKKIVIGGRSAHFCDKHQRLYN